MISKPTVGFQLPSNRPPSIQFKCYKISEFHNRAGKTFKQTAMKSMIFLISNSNRGEEGSSTMSTSTNNKNSSNNRPMMITIIKPAEWPAEGIQRSEKCLEISTWTSSMIHSTRVTIIILTRKVVVIMVVKGAMKVQGSWMRLHKLKIKALQRISWSSSHYRRKSVVMLPIQIASALCHLSAAT